MPAGVLKSRHTSSQCKVKTRKGRGMAKVMNITGDRDCPLVGKDVFVQIGLIFKSAVLLLDGFSLIIFARTPRNTDEFIYVLNE